MQRQGVLLAGAQGINVSFEHNDHMPLLERGAYFRGLTPLRSEWIIALNAGWECK